MSGSTPAGQLAAIAELAQAAAVAWATYEATEAALAAGAIPARGDGIAGRGDISRPVEAIALSHQRYHDTAADVAQALTILRRVQSRMGEIRKQHPDHARSVDAAIRAARCSGEVDPLCVRNAVRDGLCWGCYQRRRRARLAAAAARAADAS